MMSLKHGLVAVSLLAVSLPTVASNIDNLQALSQPEFRLLSEDLGAALSYKPLTPTTPLGLTGFDVGIAVTDTKLENSAVFAKAGADISNAAVPSLRVHKGLPFGIDVGVMVGAVPSTNIKLYGGELRYAIVPGGVAMPAIGVRGSYTKLTGVDQLDFDSKGLDLAQWHPCAVEGILVAEQSLRGHQYEFRIDEPRLRGRPDGQGEQLRRKAWVPFLAAAIEKHPRPVDHFARGDSGRAEAGSDQSVRGGAVEVDAGEERLKRLGALRDERGDHAGEGISHAGRGHPGITRRIDPEFPVRRGDHAAVAFQNDTAPIALRDRPRRGDAVRLRSIGRYAQQPPSLGRMRRQDSGHLAFCERRGERPAPRDQVERVGVENKGKRRSERGAEQFPCRVGLAHARACDQDVDQSLLEERSGPSQHQLGLRVVDIRGARSEKS